MWQIFGKLKKKICTKFTPNCTGQGVCRISFNHFKVFKVSLTIFQLFFKVFMQIYSALEFFQLFKNYKCYHLKLSDFYYKFIINLLHKSITLIISARQSNYFFNYANHLFTPCQKSLAKRLIESSIFKLTYNF